MDSRLKALPCPLARRNPIIPSASDVAEPAVCHVERMAEVTARTVAKRSKKWLKKLEPIGLKDLRGVERAVGLRLLWGGDAREK